VNGIAQYIPSTKVYAPEDATKVNFLEACQTYSMVHVPTHGILNEEDPGFSFISFTQSGKDLDVSELLFVKDLYAQNWDLDLAFFSACQTASGRHLAGEGNISMARGLAYAGVRSFITTQWNVPTATKSKIAPIFYEELVNKEKTKDVALATAKRAVAGRYPPREWAGLILIGTTD